MRNWFTYFLTLLMTVLLFMGSSLCGCAHAHALDFADDTSEATIHSEVETPDEPVRCACASGDAPDDEESDCPCGCDEIAGDHRKGAELTGVAVAPKNPLDDFEAPALQPRFQALLAVWFADFLGPFLAPESEAIALFVDPGPPGVDIPIYLQVQNLRL